MASLGLDQGRPERPPGEPCVHCNGTGGWCDDNIYDKADDDETCRYWDECPFCAGTGISGTTEHEQRRNGKDSTMTKKQEEIFGWTVEQVNDNRVILTKGDEVHDIRSGPDLTGAALVKHAVMQRINMPEPKPAGLVFEVPVASGKLDGAES